MKNSSPVKGVRPNKKDSQQKHKEKHEKKNHADSQESKQTSKVVEVDKKEKARDKGIKNGRKGNKNSGKTDKGPSKDANSSSPAKTQLEEAIYALGGDEEDYLLVKNVDEDGFTPGADTASTAADPALQGDLKKFMKSLGIKDINKKTEPESWIVEDTELANASDQDSEGDSSQEQDESEDEENSDNENQATVLVADSKRNHTLSVPAAPSASKKSAGGSNFIFSPNPRWYEAIEPLAPSNATGTPSEHAVSALYTQAESLITADTELYTTSPTHVTSSSDATFLGRVLSYGTLSDRLSALTLMVQASPVHNTRALETLKGMAAKRGGAGAGKAEGVKALRAVVDWWVGGGGPGRKLRYFRDQPLQHPQRTNVHFVLWYFEDWLKKFFFSVLQILETLTHDTLPYMRLQSLQFLSMLLTSQPEQEHNILKLLTNKLGDSERSVASRASYHLLNLLQAHPGMKGILVREVADLILKPPSHPKPQAKSSGSATSKGIAGSKSAGNASTANVNARYYGIVTFNQIVLSSKIKSDKEVANKLIEVYFEVFRTILGEGKSEAETEQDGAPDTRDGKGREEKRKLREKDKLRKLRRNDSSAANGGLVDGNSNDSDSKLITALLTGVNRALVFADMDDTVMDKQMDTLFRLTHEGGGSFNVAVQALGLIGKVAEKRPTVHTRFMRALYSTLLDPRLGTSSKQAMYLNLLFKYLKADTNLVRVKAFVKRFIQVLVCGGSGGGSAEMSFVCGGLYLLGELFSVSPGLRAAVSNPPQKEKQSDAYDPRKREPEFAGADDSCPWELVPLLNHYHPSVALHARQLLDNVPLTANADLSLNTFSHFLDLFVYKNPKKPKPRGASAMQPPAAGAQDPGTVRMIRGWNKGMGEKGMVNSETFWRKQIEEVPASQLFFHKFFNNKMERRRADKKAKPKDEVEEEVEDQVSESDAEEAEIWKAMKRSMPSAEVDGADPDDSEGIPDPAQSESEADSSSEQGEDNIEDSSEDDSDVLQVASDRPSVSHKGETRIDDEAELSDDALEFEEDSDDILGSEVPLDESVGDGLIHFDSDNESWQGIGEKISGKRKRKDEEDGERKKKRRVKDLPLFASLEDYERLIDAQPEDNI